MDDRHDQTHLMFEDGSIVRIDLETQNAKNPLDCDALKFMNQIEALMDALPASDEEVCPVCLGDTTCMYCGGKGCPNCRRT